MTTTTYMRYSELMAHPTRGIRRVVELGWDRRDRGGDYLVVERGSTMRDGHDVWTDTARLVASARTLYGAHNRTGKARASLRRQGVSGLVDVVRRDEVEVVVSGAPYGCTAGEGGA